MPIYAYILIAAGWLFWLAPFVLNRWNFKTPAKKDRRGRWGILLEAVAYSLLWQGRFWTRVPGPWRTALCILLLALAALLSWSATRALGRHLRFDAALSADHQLVRSGPYRLMRHPIYSSMLCVLLGTGLMITPLWLLLLAVPLFVAGTEIRVRVEDNLLASHFGDQFQDYKRNVSAYIPLVR
ncbi:MAG: isoprenylcysteine carboxylmethyltransferase family protein [Acidobacteriaceae bacterium]|nr:isoprenylcysteine carboxylmethyltransferase family protein [Acidobacteriaceae bacterium]MBV9502783.1 isoprenylcysteine carboxylmethyltransferase family protein [Acidobacteriaceae bacterium]